jgi:hypothetical protein
MYDIIRSEDHQTKLADAEVIADLPDDFPGRFDSDNPIYTTCLANLTRSCVELFGTTSYQCLFQSVILTHALSSSDLESSGTDSRKYADYRQFNTNALNSDCKNQYRQYFSHEAKATFRIEQMAPFLSILPAITAYQEQPLQRLQQYTLALLNWAMKCQAVHGQLNVRYGEDTQEAPGTVSLGHFAAVFLPVAPQHTIDVPCPKPCRCIAREPLIFSILHDSGSARPARTWIVKDLATDKLEQWTLDHHFVKMPHWKASETAEEERERLQTDPKSRFVPKIVLHDELRFCTEHRRRVKHWNSRDPDHPDLGEILPTPSRFHVTRTKYTPAPEIPSSGAHVARSGGPAPAYRY